MAYLEFKDGEKYAQKGADVSEGHEHFNDAGYVLTDNDLIIDIDELPKDIIDKMLVVFDIKTQIVRTERGIHLYYKKPEAFGRKSNRVCALGFPIEFKQKSNTKAITIKRNGKLRKIENEGIREDLPNIFKINKQFENLLGFDDGDGRNDALFKHRSQLSGAEGWQHILRFINDNIFADPMGEDEFQTIARDMKVEVDKGTQPEIAEYMVNKYKIVSFMGTLYFRRDGEYISSMDLLKRLVVEEVGYQLSHYIEEIIKQLEVRAVLVDDNTTFDIKFKNGILRDGKFIEIDYEEFTPYTIDINYYPDAKPIDDVDNYIDHLTKKDPNYRKVIGEILGHTLIVNKERKRLIPRFFIFVGGGGNGKGTLLQIIKEILNAKNVTGLSIDEVVKESYLYNMVGKLANLGDDIVDKPINETEMKVLKNISSCDFMEVRQLYHESRTVQLSASLIFTSNAILKTFEKGASYERRVMWMPMFTKVDPDNLDPFFITKQIRTEALEYWARLMVEGYKRLYTNNEFTKCQIIEDFNQEYHAKNDIVRMWLENKNIEDLEDMIIGDVVKECQTWAIENLGEDYGPSAKQVNVGVTAKFGFVTGNKRVEGKQGRRFYTKSNC